MLATVIGVIGGLGAVVFTLALELSTRLFLGIIVGFTPASPAGEGGAPITEALRPWALPFCVALGGLLSGIIVFRLAPEAEGHGTDAAIAAFHHRPRGIRGRVPIVKLVASAITIGSGGSAGREGPTAQISAGFGSFLSRTLDLDQHDSRIAVAAGMAAGIGAIFRAPLGAAVLGAELLYRDDVESSALLPSFIATIVAFSVYGLLLGNDPIFGVQAAYHFDPFQLGYYALIGLAAGLMGLLYIRSFYGVTAWSKGWSPPVWFRPAIGGFLVGCIGLAVPGRPGHGLWLGTGGARPRDAHGAAARDDPRAAVREDPGDLAVDRHRRLGWRLRTGHGHRRTRRAPASGACSRRSRRTCRSTRRRSSSWA